MKRNFRTWLVEALKLITMDATQEKLYNQALAYIATVHNLSGEKELNWGIQAIHNADIHGFELQSSANKLDRLRYDLWELDVSFYVKKLRLSYAKVTSAKEIAELYNYYWETKKKLELHTNF